MKDTDLGIYCVNQKKFYYLESGEVVFPNPIPKLTSTLQQRNLIDFNSQTYMDTSNYLIRTVREARSNEWEMERVFATTHIKNMFLEKEKQLNEVEEKSTWGKKATDKKAVKKPVRAEAE